MVAKTLDPVPNAADERLLENIKAHLRKRPGDARGLVDLGRLLFQPFRQSDIAVQALEQAFANASDASLKGEAAHWWARCLYFDFSDAPGAVKVLERCLREGGGRPECIALLALIRIDGGQYAEAVKLLEMAVVEAPDWLMPRSLLARALYETGEYDLAEEEAMKVVSYLHRKRPPQDSLSAYWEMQVTGRAHPGNEGDIMELLGRIRKKRLGRI